MIKVHLARILEEKGLKIVDLVNMTGLHRNGISNLVNEKTKGIDFDTLEKICVALDCNLEDLLEIVKEEKDIAE
ncbi:XRE family transcriptional regulator [Bacillus clarus]|uniref:Helix-turn-helix family protein n=1 Tax=Bacillus clarus TaxID=2338372 RepID=A0A090YM48_9BACI|nr:helix-turn-helix transcriptional regulator [Bacillus clarus]KFM99519.1 helix-turn-helix family protein [Bacillus clarus]RFT67202.1 XRE family transcriptional regulator [Bacillus clarus]